VVENPATIGEAMEKALRKKGLLRGSPKKAGKTAPKKKSRTRVAVRGKKSAAPGRKKRS
jgi:hypothetical protein